MPPARHDLRGADDRTVRRCARRAVPALALLLAGASGPAAAAPPTAAVGRAGEPTVSATDPRAIAPGAWTIVRVEAPRGAQLCLGRESLPAGCVTFWVRPGFYDVAVSGDSLMNFVATLDATAAPAELALKIPAQPDLTGAWSGDLAGAPVQLLIEGGRCGQGGCRVGPGGDGGVFGSLRVLATGMTSGDPALAAGSLDWRLRGFEWLPDQHVVAFTALPGGGWGDGECSFRLHLEADGALSGTCTASVRAGDRRERAAARGDEGGGAAGGDRVLTHRTVTLTRAAR